jgi:predicted Zn-dependent peptidase
MKKTNIEKLKLEIYEEKLDNGLEIYIIPKNNCNNIYATFSTKYGSNIDEFVPINSKKMKKFPLGIAHFLEHKMFEMEDGTDPFELYSNNGADANANTSNYKTTYLFSGPQYFKENINYLLDYVQKPYFTDKNVEKEKGIIIQEIKMYQDDPYSVLYEKAIYNSFIKHPIKMPVIGDIENVKSITKEDLYECYNTFYNPANMFIVITGNIDPKETIEIIKQNQEKKQFDKEQEIKIKTYEEPDKVEKKSEIIKMDINLPKLALSYKINYKKLNLTLRDALAYISIIFDINLGATSIINEKLKDDGIITTNIDFTFMYTDTHILITVFGETEKIEKLSSELENQINNLEITEEEFERKKQNIASSYIFMSDNIFSMNEKIMNNISKYNEIKIDDIKYTKRLDYKKAQSIIKELDLSNKSIVIIEPK